MLHIAYTTEPAFGEPGPSWIWTGSRNDFLRLLASLADLTAEPYRTVRLEAGQMPRPARFAGFRAITLASAPDGADLVRREGDEILVRLPRETWMRIAHRFLAVALEPRHDYVEFDERPDLREDATWIIASDAAPRAGSDGK